MLLRSIRRGKDKARRSNKEVLRIDCSESGFSQSRIAVNGGRDKGQGC